MNASRWTVLVMSLLLLACAASGAAAAGWQDKKEVEQGGWHVAYGNELSEADASAGTVAPGVYIYAERRSREMERLHGWADALVQQAEAKMSSSLGVAGRGLNQDERWQARRLTVRTVRELLRSGQEGVSEIMTWNGIECKAGVLRYWGRRGGGEAMLLPYVGLRRQGGGAEAWRHGRHDRREDDNVVQHVPDSFVQDDSVVVQHIPPSFHEERAQIQMIEPHGPSSSEVLNALSLTNTARKLHRSQWEWTARIQGPPRYLRQISSVKYYLHHTFRPSEQYGDSSQPGHPLTATGWGVFELRAEVTLQNGSQRIYQHWLQFR